MAKKPLRNKVEPNRTSIKDNKKEVFTTIEDSLWRNHWGKILTLVLLSIVIYFKTASYGYVLDDQIVITDNQFTKKGFSGIRELMTTESMHGYFGEQKNLVQGNRYRPLSLVSFAMEYGVVSALNIGDSAAIKLVNASVKPDEHNTVKAKKESSDNSGLNPGLSHVINILLYAICCILIMRCIQLLLPYKEKIFGIFDIGFVTALLYLSHPLHVEAVANIKGRDEIMAVLFAMASTYFIILYYKYGKSFKILMLGLLMFLLGLLSKENTITFLAVIPMSLYFFTENGKSKAWKCFALLASITMCYLLFRFSVSGVPKFGAKINDIMNNPFLDMSFGEKLATIFYTLILYIKLLIVPYPLTHDYYPYAIPIMNWTKWQSILSLAAHGGLIYLGWKGYKQKSIAGYSLLFYLITLTIVSNILINLGTFMNDRFIFMPSIGYCLLIAWAIFYFGSKVKSISPDILRSILFLLPMVAYCILSFIRVPDWETAMTLNRSAMKISENSARANSFMSTALFEEYKTEVDRNKKKALIAEALPYASKAVKILPKYFNANLMYSGIAGEDFNMNGDLNKTLLIFDEVITNRPDVEFLTEYLKYLGSFGVHNNSLVNFYKTVGQKKLQQGNADAFKWGIHYMGLGLELAPEDKILNELTGECYIGLGDTQRGMIYKNKAAALK